MTKKRFFLLWGAAGAVILLLLTILAGYVLAMREKPDLKNSRFSAVHANEVPLGSKADLRLEVTLPVNLPPPVCTVEPPAGTVAGKVEITHGRYLWKHNLWIIKCPLYAMKPGAAAGGKVFVSVKGRFPAEETFVIPDFVITPVTKTADKLDLAGKLDETSAAGNIRTAILWIFIALAVLLIGVWLWLRQRRKTQNSLAPIPPWVQAELALDRLSMEVAEQKMPLGTAFFRLTDVVRRYLEDRYRLPVTSRTTDEFMVELRETSPLPVSDQPFLREFLTSADLIKFAKMPPDEKGIQHALTGARELVKHTTPTGTKEESKHV